MRARIDARWCLAEASHDGVSVLTKTEAVGAASLSDHHRGLLSRLSPFLLPSGAPHPFVGLVITAELFLFAARPSFPSISTRPSSSFMNFYIFHYYLLALVIIMSGGSEDYVNVEDELAAVSARAFSNLTINT